MPNAKLIMKTPGQPDREVRLSGGASIGRSFDNSVPVKVDGVSRYHAVIEQRSDGFWLSDLGSRNGTTVNGSAVKTDLKLNGGESIVLGGIATLEFHVEMARAGAPGSNSAAATSEESSPASKAQPEPGSWSTGGIVVAGIAILVVVAGIFLLGHWLIGSTSRVDTAANGRAASTTPAPPSSGSGAPSDGADRSKSADVADPPTGSTSPDPNSSADQTSNPDSNTETPRAGYPSAHDVELMALVLASQISDDSRHRFDPALIEQIREATSRYRLDFINDASRYSQDIKPAFSNKGLSPVLGLVLAMSQSRFKAGKEGIWRMPASIARDLGYLKPDENEKALTDPKRSSEIAATYVKQLLDQLGGKKNFMYAIACYGDRIEAATEMRQRLDSNDPTGTARLDFSRMVKEKAVSSEGQNRIILFFAAGIVGQHPVEFGLSGEGLDSLVKN